MPLDRSSGRQSALGRIFHWERWHPAGVNRASSSTRRQDAGAPGPRERVASALAIRRGLSLNRLFQKGLDLMERQERGRTLFDHFSRIAAAAEEVDVEFALSAQTEATRKP